MMTIERPADLMTRVGSELGVSDWLIVDQRMIDDFAEATGDLQWIHVDRARAAREMPDGKTIAHGYLLLSLLPRLSPQIFTIEKKSRSVNYGINRVRFTAPVQEGADIRLRQTVAAAEEIPGGVRLFTESTMEIRDFDRPALVAETISLIFD